MGLNKIILPLIVMSVAAGCAGTGVRKTSVKYASVVSDRGVALRENPSVKAGTVVRVPGKAIMAVIDDQGPVDTVDGRKDRWVRVSHKGQGGWVFGYDIIIREGGYESILPGEPGKEARYHAEPNGFSDILLQLGADGRFNLIIPGYSFGEYEKRNYTANFKGEWKLIKGNILITFDCEKKENCDFRNLLLDKNGRRYYDYDGIAMISQREFSFYKDLVRIYILGVSCKKTD